MAKKLPRGKLEKLLKDIMKNYKEEFTDYDLTLEVNMFNAERKCGVIETEVRIHNYTKV